MLGTDANGRYINVRYWQMATSDARRSEWVQNHIDRYRASDGRTGISGEECPPCC